MSVKRRPKVKETREESEQPFYKRNLRNIILVAAVGLAIMTAGMVIASMSVIQFGPGDGPATPPSATGNVVVPYDAITGADLRNDSVLNHYTVRNNETTDFSKYQFVGVLPQNGTLVTVASSGYMDIVTVNATGGYNVTFIGFTSNLTEPVYVPLYRIPSSGESYITLLEPTYRYADLPLNSTKNGTEHTLAVVFTNKSGLAFNWNGFVNETFYPVIAFEFNATVTNDTVSVSGLPGIVYNDTVVYQVASIYGTRTFTVVFDLPDTIELVNVHIGSFEVGGFSNGIIYSSVP